MFSRQFARALWESLLAYLVGRLFLTGGRSAAIRRWGMVVVGFFLWTWLALSLHPYAPNSEPVLYTLLYPLRSYFAADVFKHVLIAVVVFWLAYRAAAIYLDDIFELKNIRISERFIRQSAFGSRYDSIEIVNGDVAAKDRESPMVLIGGPGKVRVYLENAALFEKIGGEPHVIGPTTQKSSKETGDKAASNPGGAGWRSRFTPSAKPDKQPSQPAGDGERILDGFERLRHVIDLRDQVETITVHGRTRDGLRIRVEDVKVIFSVLRDGQKATLQRPYPFDPEALKKIVYGFPRQNWTRVLTGQIHRELGSFISRHTLSEFLAAIGPQETEQLGAAAAELTAQANQMAGLVGTPAAGTQQPPPFVARPTIRGLFYDLNNFVHKAREAGVELRWIGLGTWVLPDEIIPERHVQAWRISAENLGWGNPAALEAVFRNNRAEQLQALVAETPLQVFEGLDVKDPSMRVANMARLVNAYRSKLYAALEAFRRQGKADSPEAHLVERIWTHLTHVVAHFAGDY